MQCKISIAAATWNVDFNIFVNVDEKESVII